MMNKLDIKQIAVGAVVCAITYAGLIMAQDWAVRALEANL